MKQTSSFLASLSALGAAGAGAGGAVGAGAATCFGGGSGTKTKSETWNQVKFTRFHHPRGCQRLTHGSSGTRRKNDMKVWFK